MAFSDEQRKKFRLVNRLQRQMMGSANASQAELFEIVLDAFLSRLDVDESGAIRLTNANFAKVAQLERAVQKFDGTTRREIVQSILNGFLGVNAAFDPYINSMFDLTKKRFGTITKRATEKAGLRWGFDGKKLIDNGYLADLTAGADIRTLLKQEANKAIASQMALKDFQKNFRTIIKGSTKKLGIVERYFFTNSFDAFQEYDRTIGLLYADELKMRAAIYNGGTIPTTRPFCRARDGKIFTREEIASWEDLTFSGKPPNYDPFTDVGGYNCRHSLDWISDELAIRRRPDLKEVWGIDENT